MASIPQGAFAAHKVRQSLSKVVDNGGTYSKTKDDKSGKIHFFPPTGKYINNSNEIRKYFLTICSLTTLRSVDECMFMCMK